MAEVDEVTRKNEYVLGTHGQTVMVVPPKVLVVSLEKKEDTWCWVGLIFYVFLGSICLCLGIVYGRSVFPREDLYEEWNRPWLIAACSLLGIAALFTLLTAISCCYLRKSNKFMRNRGSPLCLAYPRSIHLRSTRELPLFLPLLRSMSQDEYVLVPHRQTMMVVPPKILEKKEDTWCLVGLIFYVFLGIICLCLGIVYGTFVFPREDLYEERNRPWLIAACSLLGIAALFALLSAITCCYLKRSKKRQVTLFMHKRGSPHCLPYQALEGQGEEEALTKIYEEFTPEIDFPSYPGNKRGHSSQGYKNHQRQLAAGAHPSWNRSHNSPLRNYSQIPSQPYGKHNAPTINQLIYPHNDDSPKTSQPFVELSALFRSGQPMQPVQHCPQHMAEFSISRGYTSGEESPYRSSPIREGSLSPSSETTSLSSQASEPETQ